MRLLVDPIVLPATLDRRVLLFVFVLTLVVGLMLGLLPALRITKTPVATGLRDQGRGIAGSAAWLRIGAPGGGRPARPVAAAARRRRPAGAHARQPAARRPGLCQGRPRSPYSVDAQAAGYEPARQAQAFEDLLARVRAVPGVRVATVLEQRAVRRLGQRRPDHCRGLHAEGRWRSRIELRRRRPRLLLDARRAGDGGARDHRAGSRRRRPGLRHQRDLRAALLRRAASDRAARHAALRRPVAHLRGRRRRQGLAAEPPARPDRAPLLHAGDPAGGQPSAPSASSSARAATAPTCCRRCGA